LSAQSLQTERSQIEAGGNVTIYGAQSVTLSASDVDAGGKALVQSKGDVELGYNTDTEQHNWTTSHMLAQLAHAPALLGGMLRTVVAHLLNFKRYELQKMSPAQLAH
jgi:hypothetical protein